MLNRGIDCYYFFHLIAGERTLKRVGVVWKSLVLRYSKFNSLRIEGPDVPNTNVLGIKVGILKNDIDTPTRICLLCNRK